MSGQYGEGGGGGTWIVRSFSAKKMRESRHDSPAPCAAPLGVGRLENAPSRRTKTCGRAGGVRLRYGAYGMELRYGATVWSVLRGTVGEEVWGNLIDPTEQQPPAHRGARSAVGRHERGVLALHPNGVCVSTCRRVSEISS